MNELGTNPIKFHCIKELIELLFKVCSSVLKITSYS